MIEMVVIKNRYNYSKLINIIIIIHYANIQKQ